MTQAVRWKANSLCCRFLHGYRYPVLFIACCPKSASTWFSHLLAKAIPGYRYLHPEEFRRPDGTGCDITPAVVDAFAGKFAVGRAHTPATAANVAMMDQAFGKYMFCMRDMRDVAASLYYHVHRYPRSAFIDTGETRQLPWQSLSPDVLTYSKEKCLDVIIAELMPALTTFVRQWLKVVPQQENCLLLRYEDITQDTEAEVCRVLRFFDIPVSQRRIAHAVDRYHRSRLCAGTWKFRKGEAGNWRQELTGRQQRVMLDLCDDVLPSGQDAA